jgi:hypothetical protein
MLSSTMTLFGDRCRWVSAELTSTQFRIAPMLLVEVRLIVDPAEDTFSAMP